MTSTRSCSEGLETLAEWIDRSDRILVGAGAGLSVAAGMTLDGERYRRNFPDFIARYNDPNMYVAGFRRYGSLEERWAYWSRAIMMDRYEFEDNGTYADLLGLLRGRDYFVLTTNVDHCFQRFGFDKDRLFYTQGDYGLWQCSGPCCARTYDNEAVVRKMFREQSGMRVPTELVPYCPRCGRPMTMNLRIDDGFVQDDGWYRAAERYRSFARRAGRGRTLFLELGVGYNTPGIIKFPFWRMASENPESRYASVSLGTCQVPDAIADRSVGIDMDIRDALRAVSRSAARRPQSVLCALGHQPLVPPSPVLEGVEDRVQAGAQLREAVLDPGRHLREDLPRDQALLLHRAELLRQDLLGYASQRLLELAEPLLPGPQVPQDEDDPLIAYHEERGLHRARREFCDHAEAIADLLFPSAQTVRRA